MINSDLGSSPETGGTAGGTCAGEPRTPVSSELCAKSLHKISLRTECVAGRASPDGHRAAGEDRHLADNEYMAGDEYSIADMAIWPWYGAMAKGIIYDAGEFLQVHEYTNVIRWTDQLAARPAVQRGRMVNRTFGEPSSQLRERHDASDFETKTQDKIEAAE